MYSGCRKSKHGTTSIPPRHAVHFRLRMGSTGVISASRVIVEPTAYMRMDVYSYSLR